MQALVVLTMRCPGLVQFWMQKLGAYLAIPTTLLLAAAHSEHLHEALSIVGTSTAALKCIHLNSACLVCTRKSCLLCVQIAGRVDEEAHPIERLPQ